MLSLLLGVDLHLKQKMEEILLLLHNQKI
jgi:hypothetical protein